MQKSLGLIETQGLLGGVTAADAAVKSANVELIGYELTKGGGWTTVKIQGDVGAVKAAVDAAKIAAAKVNRVVSTKVIPRPASALDMLVFTKETVGYQPPEPPREPDPPSPPELPPVEPDEPPKEEAVPEPEPVTPEPEPAAEVPAEPEAAVEPEPAAEPEAPAEEPEAEAPVEEPEGEAAPAEPSAEEPASEEAAPAEEAKPKTVKKAPAKRGSKRKQ